MSIQVDETPVAAPARTTATKNTATGLSATHSDRIHYLDNLRGLAMLLGVFLHAAFAYAHPAQSFWLATDPKSSAAIDAGIWFIHLFRMSLFFLLSGYFGKWLVTRKGMGPFLWNRTLRIICPFLLFYPFLWVAMGIVIVFALSYIAEPTGLLGIIVAAGKQTSESNRQQPWSTMHLWFLYYLIFFSAIAAVLSRFQGPKVDWLFKRPSLAAIVPLALVPGILGAGVPLPAPESFIPAWWPFAFYGLFYWVGWQLYGREHALEAWSPYAWPMVAGSVLLFIPYYLYMPFLDLPKLLSKDATSMSSWSYGLVCVLTAYLSVSLTMASLLLGKQYLSKRSSWLKFMADASYWIYLIHLPIVLFLQTLLIPLQFNVWLKLSVTLFCTLMFCLATYVVFVRYTPIGWLLHGKRSFP